MASLRETNALRMAGRFGSLPRAQCPEAASEVAGKRPACPESLGLLDRSWTWTSDSLVRLPGLSPQETDDHPGQRPFKLGLRRGAYAVRDHRAQDSSEGVGQHKGVCRPVYDGQCVTVAGLGERFLQVK